ncbi:MAG: formate--tetrahydrofolate ligase [Candidatus Omnitrophica bacterium]|nr:formate--tetrahydrofolate ligase [Candidatus Omnitrophota bacterium]MBU4477827.1 formate--tetrahydrofolate ligase [Candidatus Omnitrophota bacterium]MCG2703460.1 formate--tetrahydrofolate ligase [Candidatus Omnitrophota bacterium]
MRSDLEIAQSIPLIPITEIASRIGINEDELEPHGKYKAKISLQLLERLKDKQNGKYIDVTAITPTPLGEGKTLTTIGLSLSLNKINKKAVACIRQPSLGPVFGIKGGAAGGGYAQVLPMEDINLHFTGDVHAVGAAHNLCAAFLDNHILKGNAHNIDPQSIVWRRVVGVNDRFLREVIVGLGGGENGFLRETGFDITEASEVMAILALTTGVSDLRRRLGKIFLGTTYEGKSITPEDIKVAGAMAALLKDALKPNIIQTTEGTACFIHTGPFGNIAHGNSSILSDRMALKLADYVVTESGFGADLGAEKFMDIKCRYSGLKPDCVVLVCSVRALKMHSGKFEVVAGKPLAPELCKENPQAITAGSVNLQKQIENIRIFGVPVVVAINKFETDTDRELELVRELALKYGADDAVVNLAYSEGGNGARELAQAVVNAADKPNNFNFLYPLEASIKEKIETIAVKIYGADGVSYHPLAEKKIKQYTDLGFDKLPICMAKTHLSLSHDPALKGRPKNFTLPIRDIRASVGAGFIYPLCGKMQTMPGLPSSPCGEKVDIDETGKIKGLF